MPYPLNNVATADQYSDTGATLDTQPSDALFVAVRNAAVYFRVTTRTQGVRGGTYPEKFLTPGRGTLGPPIDWREGEQVVKVEFRSAVTLTPARVDAY